MNRVITAQLKEKLNQVIVENIIEFKNKLIKSAILNG
tara:strand:- start:416 stop:526 length:111 start_codon:yes stop_codon:yes gene_type:complete